MGERIFDLLRGYFAVHGYWTLALAMLLENAGVPVPGETVLLFASFLAYSEHHLKFSWIVLTATVAATLGDNIGYYIGHRGGRPLLDRYRHWFHVPPKHIRRGEQLFQQYGCTTIFFARFIFGLRVIAGPLAGVLRMSWRRFALFNALGAAFWVVVISTVGYIFGRHWSTLIHVLRQFNIAVGAIVIVLIVFTMWRRRRDAARPLKP